MFRYALHVHAVEFEVRPSGGLSASYQGYEMASVRLSCDLSGPDPWHAKGKAEAEVNVACFHCTARFNKTCGNCDSCRNRGEAPQFALREPDF